MYKEGKKRRSRKRSSISQSLSAVYEFHSQNNETAVIYHLLTTLISLDFCRCIGNRRENTNPFNILHSLIASAFLPIIFCLHGRQLLFVLHGLHSVFMISSLRKVSLITLASYYLSISFRFVQAVPTVIKIIVSSYRIQDIIHDKKSNVDTRSTYYI